MLRKEPMSREVRPGDAFSINDAFTSKLYKVKIGMVAAQRESEGEKAETREKVEEDRKPQVGGCAWVRGCWGGVREQECCT